MEASFWGSFWASGIPISSTLHSPAPSAALVYGSICGDYSNWFSRVSLNSRNFFVLGSLRYIYVFRYQGRILFNPYPPTATLFRRHRHHGAPPVVHRRRHSTTKHPIICLETAGALSQQPIRPIGKLVASLVACRLLR